MCINSRRKQKKKKRRRRRRRRRRKRIRRPQNRMKPLKCKPSAQFAYNYTINVLSKCSNIILHQSSVFEGRHNDHLSSKVGTSKVDTSIIDP